ncbi:MAG: signal peptide peptidase SppA [Phycisphaerales bacterium]|nr:signal peptide peptidase SppA [Phycisphaerales bacterium]
MKTGYAIPYVSVSICLIALALLAGCEPVAYKITPVPVDKSLEEEVLIDEGGWSPAKIVLVDVDGMLFNHTKPSLFAEGENPVSLFVEKLDKAAKDSQAQALLLRINSPGGSVTASDLMHSEVMHFKRRTGGQRPVVAVLMDVAASGGYYVACAADEIVASPTTVTGSVGVLMQMINFSGTMSRIGISADAITSGPMKDAGSPLREMKPEEREIFQNLVNEFYDRFVQVVATGRPNLDEKQVRDIADGRVWSAPQALELGIIDRIGTLRDALVDLKSKIGANRVRVVTYKRPLGWKPNIYAQHPTGPTQFNMINLDLRADWMHPQPQFLYLWDPRP